MIEEIFGPERVPVTGVLPEIWGLRFGARVGLSNHPGDHHATTLGESNRLPDSNGVNGDIIGKHRFSKLEYSGVVGAVAFGEEKNGAGPLKEAIANKQI